MNTRVLLSMEHEQALELLQHAFADCPDVDVVGVTSEPLECLMLIARRRPHLWIHSWEDGAAIQGMLSHVYQYHPNLVVVRLNPEEPSGYMQMQINSMADLLRLATQRPLELETA